MKTKTQVQPLEFVTRGHRRRPGYGKSYRTLCGKYRVYFGDQVDGVRWKDHDLSSWFYAIHVDDDGIDRIISRHEYLHTAQEACQRHHRRQHA